MLLESKVLLSNDFFHTNLTLLKIQTVKKSHSLMIRGIALGHFDIFDTLSPGLDQAFNT